MKHLIIFSIILIGILLLSPNLFNKSENFEDLKEYNEINYQNSSVYIKKSNIGGKYGRGIFSNKKFNKDDIIEIAPYIEDKTDIFNGIVRDYIFNKNSDTSIVAFGFASLYNHSDTPNAIWIVNDSNVTIKAINPIKKNEEIFISYGEKYWLSRNDLEKK